MTTTEAIAAELATLPADLSAATPREIDTVLAALYELEGRTLAYLLGARDSVHRSLGQRPQWYGRQQRYAMPFDEALALAEATVRDPDYTAIPNSPRDVLGALRYLAEQTAALAEIDAAQAPLHEEYARRPWSRFFWVKASGGHCHSSMACSTCNKMGKRTDFGWNPELSGKTEAEAVAKLGPSLCTVCFPSAPVEWTIGKQVEHCSGSRKAPVAGTVNRRYRTAFGQCTGCGQNQNLTQYGEIKAHKPPKSK